MYRKWLYIPLLFAGVFMVTAQIPGGDTPVNPSEAQVTVQEKIKVFPNPADQVVNVIGIKNSPKAAISVADAYGNLVAKYSWAIKNEALNIPVSNLDPGVYSITVRSENQQVTVKFYKR